MWIIGLGFVDKKVGFLTNKILKKRWKAMKQPKKFKRIKRPEEIKAGKSFFRMTIIGDEAELLCITNRDLVAGQKNKNNFLRKWCFLRRDNSPPFNRASLKDYGIEESCSRFGTATFPLNGKNLLFAKYLCETQDIARYREIIDR